MKIEIEQYKNSQWIYISIIYRTTSNKQHLIFGNLDKLNTSKDLLTHSACVTYNYNINDSYTLSRAINDLQNKKLSSLTIPCNWIKKIFIFDKSGYFNKNIYKKNEL
jgi:hypothetical protein